MMRVTHTYPLNDLCHELCALILQPRKTEELGRLPHVQDVVLTNRLGERLPTETLQPRQQVHVSHAEHIKHAVHRQLDGEEEPISVQDERIKKKC